MQGCNLYLLCLRVQPYSEEEIGQIIRIRCDEEGVETTPDAQELLTRIGFETSLRYALHLITSAALAAQKRKKGGPVDVEDVSRVYSLFVDVKRSTQFLMEYNEQFMFHEVPEVPVDNMMKVE